MEWDLFSLYSVKQENGHSCLPKEAESASVDKHQNFLYSYIASKRNCNIHKSLEYLIFILLHLFSTSFVIFERLVFSLCLRLVATAKKQIRVKIVFLTILFWKKKNGSLLNT